jgi:hypothetical protein
MAEMDWTYPPLLEQNEEDVWLEASATTGTGITIDSWSDSLGTVTEDLFDAGHVGSYWRIRHERTPAQQSITGSSAITELDTEVLDVSFSDWKLTTDGTWNGLVEIWQSIDGGDYEKLAIVGDTTNVAGKNFSLDSETPAGANTKLRINFVRSSGTLNYNLYAENPYIEGLVKITVVTDAHTVTADVINDLGSTDTTKRWTEGAFSDFRGHPRTVTFHEDRLWFCGTNLEPATIYASVSGDYFNFLQGTQVDSSIKRVPDSPEPAQWMVSKKVVRLGTSGGAMTIQSVDDRENINVDTINTPSQSEFGSEYIQGVLTNDVVVYAQKSGRKIREMIYNWEEENYRSNDITILSEQVTEGGVVEMFLQKQPDQIIHCVKGNGDIAALTYERTQEVVGWGRTVTNGSFESGCALPSSAGEDDVFVCVERNGRHNIELFQKRADLEWYVDGGKTISGIATQDLDSIAELTSPDKIEITKVAHGLTDGMFVEFLDVEGMVELNESVFVVADKTSDTFTLKDVTDTLYIDGSGYGDWTADGNFTEVFNQISGLDHLDDTVVQVIGDNSYIDDVTVTSGVASFDTWANTIIAGHGFVSYLQPMFLEPVLGDRLSASRKKAVSKCSFKVYNSKGALIGPPDKRKAPLIQRKTTDIADEAIAVDTGEHRIFMANDWKREKDIEIEQNLPYPLTVLSMAVWTRAEGG